MVILIILLVSAVALPTVLPALNHRQVSEAARILQGALVGARDKAIHEGQPSGIRLLPDPTYPIAWITTADRGRLRQSYSILAYNRIVPIDPAPEYAERLLHGDPTRCRAVWRYPAHPSGRILLVTADPRSGESELPVLCESPVDTSPASLGAPNPPTNWFWNIRVGDKVQVNNAGPWYTVVGPMTIGPQARMLTAPSITTPSSSSTRGPPGQPAIALPTIGTGGGAGQAVEFLMLVNGQDDNNDGWVNEQADGVNNNGDGHTDDMLEWTESRRGSARSPRPA